MGKHYLTRYNFILFFLILVTLINIIIFAYRFIKPKPKEGSETMRLSNPQTNHIAQSEFFNSSAPDVEMLTSKGEKIILSNFVGDVIILRYTRFHLKDLPSLIYLEHLHEKYREHGFHLFIIKLVGIGYGGSMDSSINLSVPIIEDDGFISGIFQARLNDTILIGRDFRIKLKHNNLENRTIYNQVKRYLFKDSVPPSELAKDELNLLVKQLYFRNIKDGDILNLGKLTKNNISIVNLFVSTCFACPDQRRILLMKEIASQYNKIQVIILFGKGNNSSLIKKFAEKRDLLKNTIVGVIQKSGNKIDKDYYKIFQLNVDPRMFIIKNGVIVFSENLKNQRKINLDFLSKKIS